jgi:hypothetical protein
VSGLRGRWRETELKMMDWGETDGHEVPVRAATRMQQEKDCMIHFHSHFHFHIQLSDWERNLEQNSPSHLRIHE